MKYEDIPNLSKNDIEAAPARNQPHELHQVVLAAALYAEEPTWAEAICLHLANHQDSTVRGNAILGLGHLARLHRCLNIKRVKPVLSAALFDGNAHVRGQAEAAVDDVEMFMGVRIRE